MQIFAKETMVLALTALDALLPVKVVLIMGGGGSLILAHGLTLATTDIDAIPRGMDLFEIDSYIKQVANQLSLSPDWLNPYFSTFSHVLPTDYSKRLVNVFNGRQLSVEALGKEEMLIMKCFAGRKKDFSHARALLKRGVDLKIVEGRLDELLAKRIPNAQQALDFLDEVRDA